MLYQDTSMSRKDITPQRLIVLASERFGTMGLILRHKSDFGLCCW